MSNLFITYVIIFNKLAKYIKLARAYNILKLLKFKSYNILQMTQKFIYFIICIILANQPRLSQCYHHIYYFADLFLHRH